MVKHSITKRWLVNSFGIVVIILLFVEVLAMLMMKSYYYTSTEQYLSSQMSVITNAITRFSQSDNVNYNAEIKSLVESFNQKNVIELMAINEDGKIDISSSGFDKSNENSLDDYNQAKESDDNEYSTTFTMENTDENVMSYTTIINERSCKYSALRMIVSLEGINQRLFLLFLIFTVIALVILFVVFLLGMAFVRSIVGPIQKIAETARQYATGDFTNRLVKKDDDELGGLCDSVNYMATELSNAEQMKNEFISQVSHELRTPLTAIKGWSETMTAIDDRETFVKGMRVINSESERLSQMVEELLDFSRIQDGRLILNKDTIDILAELGETILMYQQRAKALSITLNYYEPEMVSFVYGDRNRLRQVFINIVDNAIKYSNEGDTVSVEAYEDKRGIVISISDTGMGISKEDLPKVKTKFFKANHTRRGSGIGLAVANEIITLHGGTFEINSEEGVGTTVVIVLPVAETSSHQKKEAKDKNVNVKIISTNEDEEETFDTLVGEEERKDTLDDK